MRPTISSRSLMLTPDDRAVRFFNSLTLTDDFAGQPFRLRPWQEHRIIRPIFGTLREDGRRQYRRVFLFLPRKQAKTQVAAGIGNFGILGTGREGEEVVCAASDRDQASHIFKKAAATIEAEPDLSRRCRIYYSTRKIEAKKSGNVLSVVSADARRQHGGNPSILLFDEFHTQRNRELYDVLSSSFGTRRDPLVMLISTAGERRDSPCYEEYQYAKKVQADPSIDPEYLPIIYEAGPDDDWKDERTWFKAMPALGDFCQIDFIRGEFRKALQSAAEEAKFRRLYLNQWVAGVAKWLRREAWERCGKHLVLAGALEGLPCFGGIDLSNNSDITALSLVFPIGGDFKAIHRYWIPEGYARECDRRRNTRYVEWARKGLVTLTEGDAIDYDAIIREIAGDDDAGTPGLIHRFDIREMWLDQWNSAYPGPKLAAAGVPLRIVRTGMASMSAPTKYLDTLIAHGRMHHADNPCLNWQADNAVVRIDPNANIMLDKDHSADKIDGMVALVLALAASLAYRPPPKAGISWT
jgi:phage terminase large subunit-like protein